MKHGQVKRAGKLVGHNAIIAILCVLWILPVVWLYAPPSAAIPA